MVTKMRIVFMGTPEFAAKTLQGLAELNEELVLAVTQPDRPAGRGLKTIPSPVKNLAMDLGVEVITPEKIKSKEVLSKIKGSNPDLIIVSAYGKIIPRSILEIPKYYPINVHASLLPKYRGAAPINWAVINGEDKTGLTIIKMNEKMDEGDILMQREIVISPDDNASTLHDKLADMAKNFIQEAVKKIKTSEVEFTPQDHTKASCAPILRKEQGLIDWNKNSISVINFIRGMNLWPGSFTFLNKKSLKIFKALLPQYISQSILNGRKAGEIVAIHKDSFAVRTLDGVILIKDLQLESKKRLPAGEFIKGFKINIGDIFRNDRL